MFHRITNRPGRIERRVLRRLMGANGAAILAGSGAEAWRAAVLRLRPGADLHCPDARDRAGLDRYCAERGIRHLDLLRCDGDDLPELLQGAARLLRHSRIDILSMDRAPDAATAERLARDGYRFFVPGMRGLRPLSDFARSGPCLALHERLLPLVLGGPKAMLDFAALCHVHGIAPRGIVHVGAHEGQEWAAYQRMGVAEALLIEANPAVFARLAARLGSTPGVILANCAIAAESGPVTLHVTSSDQSSSILPLHRHRQIYPTIVETAAVDIAGKTLDALLGELRLAPQRFNLLNIDIQGAELQAVAGAAGLLPQIEAINTEVNFEELYRGCAQIDELDDFLAARGFRRVATTCPFHKSWGDGFYVRAVAARRVVTVAGNARALGALALAGIDAAVVARRGAKALAQSDRALFDRGLVRLADPRQDGALLYLRSDLVRDVHATGGDSRGIVAMTNLGHNAGFANQLFQYAFLKLYGLRHNAGVETPPWIGEAVYALPPHRIARRRRMVKGDEWSVRDLSLWDRDRPPIDVDFSGYFQNIPAYWRPHRALLRRLFEPGPAWRAPVERWLARHKPPGATLVAIHLRRGDYRGYDPAVKPWFQLIPEDWYLRWLAAIWPSLDHPVLFVATDDREAVLPAFSAYAPLTSAAAEAEMPEPRLLADLEIMAHADVLAICNSSFSRMAALLAPPSQRCFIPSVATGTFEPYDPWAPDHFWQRFGAPVSRPRSRLPRFLRRRAP